MARKVRTDPAHSSGLRNKKKFQPHGALFLLNSSFIELPDKIPPGVVLWGASPKANEEREICQRLGSPRGKRESGGAALLRPVGDVCRSGTHFGGYVVYQDMTESKLRPITGRSFATNLL